MNWRDFFYFSKGERRALILLLCLITVAWSALILTDKRSLSAEKNVAILNPVCIYIPDTKPSASTGAEISNKDNLSKHTENKSLKEEGSLPIQSQKKSFSSAYVKTEKYPPGTIVELNTADTCILKKVPGIGSAFSRRIIKYRDLLGGFCSVDQLAEVYGIDEDRYNLLKEWFCVNPELIRKYTVNSYPADSLSKHPYINYKQAKAIKQILRQKGKVEGWENLSLLEEFTETDKRRMEPYLSFE